MTIKKLKEMGFTLKEIKLITIECQDDEDIVPLLVPVGDQIVSQFPDPRAGVDDGDASVPEAHGDAGSVPPELHELPVGNRNGASRTVELDFHLLSPGRAVRNDFLLMIGRQVVRSTKKGGRPAPSERVGVSP